MDGGGGSAAGAIAGAHMAGGTLAGNRNVAVELPGIPAGKASLVATVAVGNGDPTQRFVGDVIDGRAIGRRIGTAVAGGALVGHRHLAMVPAGRLPTTGAVATKTVPTGGDMGSRLASGSAAVVAARTIGRRSEDTVVRFGCRPIAGGLVAALAVAGHCRVYGGGWLAGGTIAGAAVAGSTLAGHRDVAVELPGVP